MRLAALIEAPHLQRRAAGKGCRGRTGLMQKPRRSQPHLQRAVVGAGRDELQAGREGGARDVARVAGGDAAQQLALLRQRLVVQLQRAVCAVATAVGGWVGQGEVGRSRVRGRSSCVRGTRPRHEWRGARRRTPRGGDHVAAGAHVEQRAHLATVWVQRLHQRAVGVVEHEDAARVVGEQQLALAVVKAERGDRRRCHVVELPGGGE